MELTDLTTYFPNKKIEFELFVEDIDGFEVGDYIDIFSGDVVLVKNISSEYDVESTAQFVTKKYRYDFEEKSVGRYWCQIIQVNKSVVSVLMIYDLIFTHESTLNENGIVIAALDGAVKNATVDELNDKLDEDYSFDVGDNRYYIIGKRSVAKNDNTFMLLDMKHGKSFSVVEKRFAEIDMENGGTSDSTYAIDTGERPFHNFSEYSFFFYGGNIRFEDKTKLHRLEEVTKSFISNGGNPYVNSWKLYAEKQMQLEQDLHDKAGTLEFSNAQAIPGNDKFKFAVHNDNAILTFIREAGKRDGEISVVIAQKLQNAKYPCYYKAVMSDKYIPGTGYVECRFEEESDSFRYNQKGTIEVDIAGSVVAYDRRMKAFNDIQNGTSANGALTYLLDGRTVNDYSKKSLNDSARLDESIIAKYFGKYPPNPSQRKAIEIALKTPDFAVIQGPPGTGKTKVIKTIHALLQAQQKKEDVHDERYLLTAYQGVATQNMAKGNDEEYGLPIIAYYGSKDSSVEDINLERWCNETTDHILANNHDLTFFTKKKKNILFIMQMRDELMKKCSVEHAVSSLGQVIDYTNEFVGSVEDNENDVPLKSLINELERTRRNIRRRISAEELPELLYYANIFPSSPTEMSDCGLQVMQTVFANFSKIDYIKSIKDILSSLREVSMCEAPDFKAIRRLKIDLILTTSSLSELTSDEREELNDLLNRIIDELKAFRFNEKQEIISDYLHSIYPGEELKGIITKYQHVVAATHQLSGKTGITKYRDVLVDEAARSCPADLMIPLASAENRIILVGDHKQLPQFVEDNVLKSILPDIDGNALFEKDSPEAIEAKYKLSMFEYMIDRVALLCQTDPAHERVVSLDTQYRMAPPIGTLVSKHFYDGKLKNAADIESYHIDKSIYDQNFATIAGKHLVWIDANKPGSSEHKSASGSISRQYEAEIIAKRILRIKNSGWDPENLEDSNRIGVITFYSKQKQIIRDELENSLGKAVADRIEVGTVDSFQGKEFGIVFLSLVRSNDTDSLGFIESKNRMCVALSRAIKCLVIVGDSGILKYNNAEEKIPALIDFYSMCKKAKEGEPYELQRA